MFAQFLEEEFLSVKLKMIIFKKHQGMDVSCVFNKRDDKYYEFKPEIETKEKIREFLNTDEQSVISQFERWWDKYKVSLKELDAK